MGKQIIRKVIAFIVIFISVAAITNYMENGNINSVSAEMSPATLPVAYIQYDNRLVNTLHGYTNAVDTTMLRDAIVPLGTEREITVWVNTAQGAYDSFSYEVRTLEGSLVENGEIALLQEKDGYTQCTTSIRMDLAKDKEYCYVLLLTKEDTQIRYYTRIMVNDTYRVDALLDFVCQFHDQTFEKDDEESLVAKHLEPNDSGNNNDLAKVSIHSNFETVTYANMHPSVISQVIPTIQEMNEEYCVFRFSFVLAAGDDTITNYYNVTEQYKAGYGQDGELYLWDYQRTQNELYNYKNVNTVKNWFKIGVADADSFCFLTSDDEKKVAFVREGQLWYYDYEKTTIVRVFGFWQEDYLDINNTFREHGIRLLTMDADGNLAFAVSGYMNRGRHEGHTGIAVYRYMAETNRTEELLFLQVEMPYAELNRYAEQLVYLNDEDVFFCYLADTLYRVDKTGAVTKLAEDVSSSSLVVSADRSCIAYPKQRNLQENQTVVLMNLQTEHRVEYNAGKQECIKTIGFVDDDFVCGKAHQADVIVKEDKSTVFPMYKLEVLDMETALLKEYEQPGTYLLNAYTQGLDIHFEKAQKQGDGYAATAQDFITLKEPETASKIEAVYRYSETSLNLLYLVFPEYIYVKTVPKMLMTKEIMRENSVDVTLEHEAQRRGYYVYNTQGLTAWYEVASGAFQEAMENRGIVLDAKGNRIWQNRQLPEYFTITEQVPTVMATEDVDSLTACLQMLVQYAGGNFDSTQIAAYGEDVEQLLYDGTGSTGLYLSQVSVDTILYYLANAVPVIAKTGEAQYVVITSYNAPAIRYYDPVTGESIREARTDFAKKMEAAGDTYITYVPR